jgi:hypothetical protein
MYSFFLKYRRSQNFVFRPITIRRHALLSHYLLSSDTTDQKPRKREHDLHKEV